jgi:hypothetical protein
MVQAFWRSSFEQSTYRSFIDLQFPLWPKLDHTSVWNASKNRTLHSPSASASASSTSFAAASMVPAAQRQYLAVFKGQLHNKVSHIRNKISVLNNDRDIIIQSKSCAASPKVLLALVWHVF